MPWRKGNKLKLVAESEAQGRILQIYEDLRHTLGIPHVNLFYRAYAVYPQFLELHWRALKPVLETQEFFRLADRLRADAYTRMHNYFEIPDLCLPLVELNVSSAARQELTYAAELFHYNDPILLLIAAIQMQAFDSRTGQERDAMVPAQHPLFRERAILIDEEVASPNIRRIYDEMKRIMGIPFINMGYTAFARWPDFLTNYWEVLKGVVQSPVYVESVHGVRDTAWSLAREIPRPVELTVSQLTDAGIGEDDVGTLVRLTEVFVKTLTGLVLNIALAKIGLEGGNVSRQETPAQGATHPERAA
jgi:hypothetical protein